MSPAVATLDRYLADFRALEQGLDGRGPDWLRRLRGQAFARFQELGFPTARKGNEPWKYTNVAPIAEREFSLAAAPSPPPTAEALATVAPWCTVWRELVLLNGRYSRALSEGPATHEPKAGLGSAVVMSLEQAIVSHEALVREHLGRYAPYDYDGFTALNTTFLRDGAFVYVPEGQEVATHIHLLFVSAGDGRPYVTYPRTLIVAAPASKVTVIESYVSLDGEYFTDPVTEITLADGAQVSHFRNLLDGPQAYHVGTSRVWQGRDSTFRSTAYAAGPALGRNDFKVTLDEPGSTCILHGLYVTAGTQHIDNNINIDHAKPHGRSRLYYKGILDGKSRAVFGGTVLVRPGADKTDAYQEDKNLLLSAGAEVDSKPSLEIYADDVKCGHGATAGAATEDVLFYMQSRGIDPDTSMQLLVKGFAAEVLDQVEVEPLREWLEGRTVRALPSLAAREASHE